MYLEKYEGMVGVDAMFILNHNKELQIHPCVEINLRYNMGNVATSLSLFTDKGFKTYKAVFPYIEGRYTGTGDLLSSLLLGWSSILKGDIKKTLENTLSTMQQVLRRTHETRVGDMIPELQLIQSRFDIIKPPKLDSIVVQEIEFE